MQTILRYAAILLAGLWGASAALAQHEGHQLPAQKPGEMQADPRVRSSLAEIDRLDLVIENARQANDPAKMRAAIDEVQNSLASIRANLLAVPPPGGTSMMPAMDHSKMNMSGMSSPPQSPPAAETKPPSEPKMDHSHMNMPGMSTAPRKPETKSNSSSKPDAAQTATPAKTKDPVCGMEVETGSAEMATYKGKTYFFCSRADKEKFLADPVKYVKR